MLEFLGKLALGSFLGLIVGGLYHLIDSGGGGSFRIKGTKKYDKFNKDSDKRVKDMLNSGTHSSKEELQEWWDKYHPPK